VPLWRWERVDLDHRSLEPVGGKEQVEAQRRGHVPQLEIGQEDDPQVMNEFFVTVQAALAGVVISNPSRTDPIVMLKHFGPGNPRLKIL
jgi:hypothetical protein